jgi:hypothetical protein
MGGNTGGGVVMLQLIVLQGISNELPAAGIYIIHWAWGSVVVKALRY